MENSQHITDQMILDRMQQFYDLHKLDVLKLDIRTMLNHFYDLDPSHCAIRFAEMVEQGKMIVSDIPNKLPQYFLPTWTDVIEQLPLDFKKEQQAKIVSKIHGIVKHIEALELQKKILQTTTELLGKEYLPPSKFKLDQEVMVTVEGSLKMGVIKEVVPAEDKIRYYYHIKELEEDGTVSERYFAKPLIRESDVFEI